MNKIDFENIMEHLYFDIEDFVYLTKNNMNTNIYEYTPLEVKYIKEQVRLQKITK